MANRTRNTNDTTKDAWKHKPIKDFGNMTAHELGIAFDMVADKSNWKNPIRAEVSAHYLEILQYAIPFHVGGSVFVGQSDTPGRIIVSSAGYYANIGA